jgi:hypothetical protein
VNYCTTKIWIWACAWQAKYLQRSIMTKPIHYTTNSSVTNKKIENEINPLTSFFRKQKLALQLPSKGHWYSSDDITFNNDNSLPVFAMTAELDMQFRAGDFTLTGKTTYDMIKGCIPAIHHPENILNIDIDAILLAIRLASYGDEFSATVSVPNTTLTRTINFSISKLLSELNNRKEIWDDQITIEDEHGTILQLELYPIPLKNIFLTSKTIYTQKRVLSKNVDVNDNIADENIFNNSMKTLTESAIKLLCSSIKSITAKDNTGKILANVIANSPEEIDKIAYIIRSMDIEFFNAMRDHLEVQRKKYTFITPIQTSTKKEINAGAPKEWSSDIIIVGSNFLPELPNAVKTILQ